MSAIKRRRMLAGIVLLIVAIGLILLHPDNYSQKSSEQSPTIDSAQPGQPVPENAIDVLATLEVKGRAPKTGYSRQQFGNGWATVNGCDMRNQILDRDMKEVVRSQDCKVTTGTLDDPYTGRKIRFIRGDVTSPLVQIDHVVALSDAWQKGAQQMSYEQRVRFANDPLELLAVDGTANEDKSNSDAASWLPSNKSFRCQYIARQIAVKHKYGLWVTSAEKGMMSRTLESCPQQKLPTASADRTMID